MVSFLSSIRPGGIDFNNITVGVTRCAGLAVVSLVTVDGFGFAGVRIVNSVLVVVLLVCVHLRVHHLNDSVRLGSRLAFDIDFLTVRSFSEVENEVFSVGVINVVGNNNLNVREAVFDGLGEFVYRVLNEINNRVFAILIFISDEDDGLAVENKVTVEAGGLESLTNVLGEVAGAIVFEEVLEGIILVIVKVCDILVDTNVGILFHLLVVVSVAEKFNGVETVGIYSVGTNLVEVGFLVSFLEFRPYISVGVDSNPLKSAVNPCVNVGGFFAGSRVEGTGFDPVAVFVFRNNDELAVEGDVIVDAVLEEDSSRRDT